MKPGFFTGMLMVFLGTVIAVSSLVFLPRCPGPDVMQCIWMLRAVSGLGLVVALSGVVMKFVSGAFAAGLQTANILHGLLMIGLATFLIGPCRDASMACHGLTQTVLVVFGVLVAFLSASDALRLSRKP